ncbi:alpha/beta hydrolase, partial [Dolichospermum sp. ST_sed3]|nr:alpha/beta hydrolase [Dolichospermum sp. ST_sed3]
NACYKDITNVFTYLLDNGIKEEDIIVYGRSLGSGPSVNIATTHNLKALILVSPYTSIFGVVNTTMADISFCLDPFRNETKIDKICCPILIFHGTDDQLIPFEHAKALQSKSKCTLVSLTGGGHNDIHSEFRDTLLSNIKELIEN